MLMPSGAPSWASTAVNLQYQPISGVSKIAYVDPNGGSDVSGQAWTYNSATPNYRTNPGGVIAFETGDAAIAAVGRDGPHAVLFANSETAIIHTEPVTSGGCSGLSAAHPFLFGVYFPVDPGSNLEGNMALFDPGLGPHSASAMFSVQRGDGFSNLIIENIYFKHSHRIADDPTYDETDATTTTNYIRPLRVFGGNQDNILLRNIKVEGFYEGISIESAAGGDADVRRETALRNVVLDNVIAKDIWPSGLGVYCFGCYRLRRIGGCVLGCGHNRHDMSLGPGDVFQGKNQGIYLKMCEEPWHQNVILAHNSHAGLQARCGGYVTGCVFWANSRNLGFGHGQNIFETRRWAYKSVAYDNLFWGSRDVGAGYPNPSATVLPIGDGIGCGRVDSFDGQRNIFVGDPHYASSDNTFAIRIGFVPSGLATYRHAGSVVYNWPPAGVANAGAVWFEEAAVSNTSVKLEGVRIVQPRAYAFYSAGSEPTTRRRPEAAKVLACRVELTGTASMYGPSGTTPARLTHGALAGAVRRGDSWGGTAPELWDAMNVPGQPDVFADEAAFIAEITRPGTRWDALAILNHVRAQPQFQPMSRIPPVQMTIPNQTYTG